MLNCGMTQKDVSDLLASEVEWDEGRIIRKRSKTADEANVPVVNYKLWPETLRLLRQESTVESAGRLLLNANGDPLWAEEITDNGRYQKTDNIKNAFNRLQKKTKITKPLKSFKKTSATLLRSNEKFSGLAGLFLGHAPQSMSDKHYTQIPQRLLDQAVTWLGQELGLIASAEQPKSLTTATAGIEHSEIQDGSQADSDSLAQGIGGEMNQPMGMTCSKIRSRQKTCTGGKPDRKRSGKRSPSSGS
jgi:hypothetical protein